MKTAIIVWSLTLAASPVWAQQTASSVKRTLPASASHVTLPPKVATPVKTEKVPDAKPAVAKASTTTAATPANGTPNASKPIAEKPAAAKTANTAESAAERIMRRLDAEFPKKAPGEKTAVKAPVTKVPPARYATSPAGTPTPLRASNRVMLNWRISLRWPDEIAPTHQVK